MRFANSLFLLLLLCVPLLVKYLRDRRHKRHATLRLSNVSQLCAALPSGWSKVYRLLPGLRIAAILLLIIALARPQSSKGDETITTEGIDIILTLDVSGSMQAEDFTPNRLEAAKKVAADFIQGRKNDRIGLVVFAGHSATQAPLTLDYEVVLALLEQVRLGMLQEDGTAIGMAIANSVNRLRSSEAKSKVIILLTDGANNKGEIDPLTAANLAKSMHQRIYTIGAGTDNPFITVDDPFFGKQRRQIDADLDEETLKQMADMTGGAYFRATDEKSLAQIYAQIEKLEKSKIGIKQYKDYIELFHYFAYAALGLLCVELVLGATRFRKTP